MDVQKSSKIDGMDPDRNHEGESALGEAAFVPFITLCSDTAESKHVALEQVKLGWKRQTVSFNYTSISGFFKSETE